MSLINGDYNVDKKELENLVSTGKIKGKGDRGKDKAI